MKCSKCGAENAPGYKFCVKCGTPLAQEEPKKMFCTKCGAELKPGTKFCVKCGTAVSTEAAGTPPVTPKPSAPRPAPVPVASKPAVEQKKKAKKEKKERSGKGLTVVLILSILLLLAAVAAAGIFAWKNGYLERFGLGADVKEERREEEEETEETEEETEETEEANPALTEGDELASRGDYLGAIEKYLEIEEDSDAYDMVVDKITEALTGYSDDAKIQAKDLVSSENLDNYKQAVADLDEAVSNIRDTLEKCPELPDFDVEDLPYTVSEIENAFCQYIYKKANAYLTDANVTDAMELLKEAKTVMEARPETEYNASIKKEFGQQYAALYAKSALYRANSWEGNASAEQIAQNLRGMFEEADYNCWLVELYENYAARAEILEPFEVVKYSGDYILPDSDTKELGRGDIEGMSREQLRMARYEIYARHGRDFSDPACVTYFNGKSWYEKTVNVEDFYEYTLNEIELKNRDLILQYELEMGYLD